MNRTTARRIMQALEPPDEGRAYLVVGPGTWGKADYTEKDAAERAWINAQQPVRALVYECQADAYVTGDGNLLYTPQDDSREQPYRIVARIK